MLTQNIEEPFSYLVPYARFPQTNTVWNISEKDVSSVFEQKIPLQEQIPSVHDAAKIGPRNCKKKN